MNVKRYYFTTYYDSPIPEEDKLGDWVKYEDYRHLQQDNADLRAKLDGAYEKIIDDLHKRVGLCSHCGKTDCAGKASGSKLPGVIATAEILSSLQSVFRALKEQDKP